MLYHAPVGSVTRVVTPFLCLRWGERYGSDHAGLDVSPELTSVCIVDAQGHIVRETKVPSEPRTGSPFSHSRSRHFDRAAVDQLALH